MNRPTGTSESPGEGNGLAFLVQALADPVRYKVAGAVAELSLGQDAEASGEYRGATVRRIAEQVQEPLRRVRYHLDALCDQGLIEVSAERRQKGVIERYFVLAHPLVVFDEEMRDVSRSQQEKMLAVTVKAILREIQNSLNAGVAVRRPGWVATRVASEVDEQGWRELTERQVEAALEAREILETSRKRIRETGEPAFRVMAANLVLEAPVPGDSSEASKS